MWSSQKGATDDQGRAYDVLLIGARGPGAFLRESLGSRITDVGEGWLIFDLPEADMGCHPADPAKGAASGTHDISFYCDDIDKTVAELQKRGVEFTDPVADHGYGLVTFFKMPGDLKVQLYQPRYTKKSGQGC